MSDIEVRAQIARLVASGANSDAREPFDRRLAAIFAEEEQAAKAAEGARLARVAAAEHERRQAARARSEQTARESQQAAHETQVRAEKATSELLDAVKTFAVFGGLCGCCAGPGFKGAVLKQDFHGLSGPLDACFGLAMVGALSGAVLALLVGKLLQSLRA